VSRIPRPKFTYANIVATIALVIAVGGGAAIAATSLPKNSVKAKQIAKEAVKTSKLAKDAATGDKVKESTLGKVPVAGHADSADTAGSAVNATNAAHASVADALGGPGGSQISPASVVQAQSTSSTFPKSDDLELKVSGFGRYWLHCNPDATLSFNYSGAPANAIESGVLFANEGPLDPPAIFLIADRLETIGSSEFGTQGSRLSVHFTAAIIGGTRTLELDGGGFADSDTPGCVGYLHASISG
jgi:hypothetical protein